MTKIKEDYARYLTLFDQHLTESEKLRRRNIPDKLFEAMEYSLTAGGKRLRPVLCLAAAEACGLKAEIALPFALGYEMIHTATLIHDDLPCMDDDDMRRGKASCHAKFGEATALIAADAFLAQGFEYALSNTVGVKSDRLLHAMKIFTHALGPACVCGGQMLDMCAEYAEIEPDYVRKVAELKTGELIKAAILSGVALATDDGTILSAFENYGKHLGAAFQIVDDILDVNATAEELGKTPGKDVQQGKINYVTAYGIEKAKEYAVQESDEASRSLSAILPSDAFLMLLPEYLVSRTK